MKHFCLTLLLGLFSLLANAQIGIFSSTYTGTDRNLFQLSSIIQLRAPIPLGLNQEFEGKKTSKLLTAQFYFSWKWQNFKKNVVFERQDDQTIAFEDPNPDHQYRPALFKTRSQMQTTHLTMQLFVLEGFNIGKVHLRPTYFVNYLIGGKFKRRYFVDDKKVIVKTKFKDDPQLFGLERVQHGVGFSAYRGPFELYTRYHFKELFSPNQGIQVRRFETGLIFNWWYYLLR